MNIEPIADADLPALLALNNANAAMLSWLDHGRLQAMLRRSVFARQVRLAQALILAFDQDSGYDGLYFGWFKQRYERFIYVDRIVVEASSGRKGLARALYTELFAYAKSAGYGIIGCEIYRNPPNLKSDAFHTALGFNEVGQHNVNGQTKARYLMRQFVDTKSPA